MTWIAMTYSVLLMMSMKNYHFLSNWMQMSTMEILMISLLPITLFMTTSFNYNIKMSKDQKIINFLMTIMMITIFYIFTTNNTLTFIYSLELISIPLVFLMLLMSKDKDKIMSIKLMFSLNMLGSLPILYFTSSMIENSLIMEQMSNFYSNILFSDSHMFCSLMLVLTVKIPTFLWHIWLTKAHVAASGALSMILASILLKMGTFGIYKFNMYVYMISQKWMIYFVTFGIISMIYFNFMMIRLFDIKFMVASSSVVHMGMMLPMLTSSTEEGMLSSMMMNVGHGMVSLVLFYLVSLIYESTQSRTMELSKSLESSNKSTIMMLVFFCMMNVGIPPFINFYSEFLSMNYTIKMSWILGFFMALSMFTIIMPTMYLITRTLTGKMKVNYTNWNIKHWLKMLASISIMISIIVIH